MPDRNRTRLSAGQTREREENGDNQQQSTEQSADTTQQAEAETQADSEPVSRTRVSASPERMDEPGFEGGTNQPTSNDPTPTEDTQPSPDTEPDPASQSPGGRFSPGPGQETDVDAQPQETGQPDQQDQQQDTTPPDDTNQPPSDAGGGDGGVPWGSGPGGAVRAPDAGTGGGQADDTRTDRGDDSRQDPATPDDGGEDVIQPGETFVPNDQPGETGEIRETQDRNVGRAATGAVTPAGGRDRFREERTPDSELRDPTPNREDFEVIQDIRANTDAGLDTEFTKVGPGAYLATYESGRQQLFTIGEAGEQAADNYLREQQLEARQEAAEGIETQLAEQGITVDVSAEDVVATTTEDGATVFELADDVRSQIRREQAAAEIETQLAEQGIDTDIDPLDLNLDTDAGAYVLEPNVIEGIEEQQRADFNAFVDRLTETTRRGYSQFRPDPDVDSFAQIRLEERKRENRLQAQRLFAGADDTTDQPEGLTGLARGSFEEVATETYIEANRETIRSTAAEQLEQRLAQEEDIDVDLGAEDIQVSATDGEIETTPTDEARQRIESAGEEFGGEGVVQSFLSDVGETFDETIADLTAGASFQFTIPSARGPLTFGVNEATTQRTLVPMTQRFVSAPIDLAQGAIEAGEYGVAAGQAAVDSVASGSTEPVSEFADRSYERGEEILAQTVDRASESPFSFGSGLAGSLGGGYLTSYAAIGGAFRFAGPRTARAVSFSIQPGEDLVRAGVRADVVPERVATKVPGVRSGQFRSETGVERRFRQSDVRDEPSYPLEAEAIDEAMGVTGPSASSRVRGRVERSRVMQGLRETRVRAAEAIDEFMGAERGQVQVPREVAQEREVEKGGGRFDREFEEAEVREQQLDQIQYESRRFAEQERSARREQLEDVGGRRRETVRESRERVEEAGRREARVDEEVETRVSRQELALADSRQDALTAAALRQEAEQMLRADTQLDVRERGELEVGEEFDVRRDVRSETGVETGYEQRQEVATETGVEFDTETGLETEFEQEFDYPTEVGEPPREPPREPPGEVGPPERPPERPPSDDDDEWRDDEYQPPAPGYSDRYRVNPIERLGETDFSDLFRGDR